MNRQYITGSGTMTEKFQQALGSGEEVVLFQRARAGNFFVQMLQSLFYMIVCGLIASYLDQDGSDWAILLWILTGIFGLSTVLAPWLMPTYEYAITNTRLIVGKHESMGFDYDVVPVDMISGVKVGSRSSWIGIGRASQLEIQRAGGNLALPVVNGEAGREMVLTITRLLEERRTYSAQGQAALHTPVHAPATTPPPGSLPSSAAVMDRQARLTALRDCLLQGQISEATYNMLRQEIENE